MGTMIPGGQLMADDGIFEKYCYNNELDSCVKYGGLYQWDEVMQYSSQLGAQGICPVGWHIPTHEEWMILEGAVDSLYGISDYEWELGGYRGYDAGKNLKSTNAWDTFRSNGVDKFGFSALPGGSFYSGSFFSLGYTGYWWSSMETISTHAATRALAQISGGVESYGITKVFGNSVRCVRD